MTVFYGTSQRIGARADARRLELGICETMMPEGIVRSVTPLDADRFLGYLRQHLATWTQHEAFVFVHRADVSFDEACLKTARGWTERGLPGVAAMFNWPAEAEPARQIEEFVELMVSQSGAANVHLVAHGRR